MYPVLFKIGSVSIYSYGLFVAAGFLIASFLMLRDSAKEGLPRESVLDSLIAILAGGVIGGRLLYVVINWGYFSSDPIKMIMLNEGGMAIHGAIVLGFIAGVVTARIKGLPVWKTADIIAPYIALGQAIGRIGCFFNGCCYGREYDGLFSVTFPQDTVSRVPTQICLSAGLLAIYIMLRVAGRGGKYNGRIFALYLILYSIFRFFVDFLRGDNPLVFSGLTLAQVISIIIFACGLFLFAIRKHGRT